MKKKYSTILFFLFVLIFSTFSFAQTQFEFNNLIASGTNGSNAFEMTETVSAKTILVNALNGTNGTLITTQSLGGFGGTDGNVMRSNPATRVNFEFNEAVDVISIIALNGESIDGTFTFTPIGGNGSVLQANIGNQSAQVVQLNWQGATGFSVTSNLGAISFFFDSLIVNDTTLTTEDFSLNTVSIYPNPTTNIVNIKSNSSIKNVELYDVLGKKIKSTKLTTISLDTFSKGIYIMKITTAKGVITKKITKI